MFIVSGFFLDDDSLPGEMVCEDMYAVELEVKKIVAAYDYIDGVDIRKIEVGKKPVCVETRYLKRAGGALRG